MHTIPRWTRAALLVAITALVPGCVAAAGAAAGAGTIAYINDQTAQSTVDAGVARVSDWTRSAFRELGITVTRTETESDSFELSGEHGDLDVKASVERDGDMTKISVTAKRNPVEYDKDYARTVLERILAYR